MARPVKLSGSICYHCGSDQTCKAGFGKNGKRQFKCRGCRKTFVEDPQIRTGERNSYVPAELPSKEYLLAELKEVAKELGRTPVSTDWPALRAQERVYPLYIYYTVFGSFVKAVKLAKLKTKSYQEFDAPDRERMLDELRVLRDRLKRPIFDEDVDEARRRGELSPPNHFI